MLTSTAEWIRAADTKAAILASALLAVLGITAAGRPTVSAVWPGGQPPTAHSWLQLVALGLGAVSLALLGGVLAPRSHTPSPNCFAWPWLARTNDEDLDRLVHGSHNARRQGWQQASVLAKIAQTKYTCFRWALAAWFGTAAAVGADLLLPTL